jgi:hypothetical protein
MWCVVAGSRRGDMKSGQGSLSGVPNVFNEYVGVPSERYEAVKKMMVARRIHVYITIRRIMQREK